MYKTLKKGDLVSFKAEHNDDEWADRIALILSFDTPYLTLLCKGELIKAPEWSVEKVDEQ